MLEAGATGARAPSNRARRRRGPYGARTAPQPTAEPLDRLPFVIPSRTGNRRRCFWAPRPTGDDVFDLSLGAQYAEAALPLLRERGGADLLSRIVLDIAKRGDAERDKALLIGMFTAIGLKLQSPVSDLLAELNQTLESRSSRRPHLRLVTSQPDEDGATGQVS